jgi:riboflavin synthase
MFTGIVASVGRIERIEPRPQGLRLAIDAGGLDLGDVAVGDSIAVNGCCLTVVAPAGASRSTSRRRRSTARSGSARRARSTWRSRCALPTASAGIW